MKPTIIYALLLLGGLAFLFIAFRHYRETMRLVRGGARTKARVVELLTGTDKNGTNYRPRFEYLTRTKEVRQYTYEISSRPSDWEVGEEAYLLYDPARPGQEKLIGYWGLFASALILAAMSLPLIVIGGGYFAYVSLLKDLTEGL